MGCAHVPRFASSWLAKQSGALWQRRTARSNARIHVERSSRLDWMGWRGPVRTVHHRGPPSESIGLDHGGIDPYRWRNRVNREVSTPTVTSFKTAGTAGIRCRCSGLCPHCRFLEPPRHRNMASALPGMAGGTDRVDVVRKLRQRDCPGSASRRPAVGAARPGASRPPKRRRRTDGVGHLVTSRPRLDTSTWTTHTDKRHCSRAARFAGCDGAATRPDRVRHLTITTSHSRCCSN